jgi:hypothetical protein
MTAMVAAMLLALLVALVVISIFSSQEKDDWTENRPGHTPDNDETDLGDLLDP